MSQIAGYRKLTPETIELVSNLKRSEETILQAMDILGGDGATDQRWLALGRTHLEQAFMATIRAVLRPERVDL